MGNLIIKNIIINNFSQGLQFGSRWILNLVLISVLSIEDFAVYSFVYSFSNILLSVLPFGSSIFLISKDYNKTNNASILQDSILVVLFLATIIILAFFILTPFLHSVKGWSYLIYGIVLSLMLSLNLVLFSYFKGLGKFRIELFVYSFFSLFLLAFVGYLYFNPTTKPIELIFSFLIILNLFVFVFTLIITKKQTNILSLNTYKHAMKNSLAGFKVRKYFGFQEIVTAIYTQIGLLILFYLLDEATYGYYRALFIIIAPIFMITVSISQVLLNKYKTIKNNPDYLVSFFRITQKYTILSGIAICIFLFFLRDITLSYIGIEQNQSALISFYIIIVIILMRFVFSNYEMLLVALDKQKQRFWIMLLSAVISVVLLFILLPQHGLVGAFSINAIAYFIVFVGTLILSETAFKRITHK
ncbi:MAG: hypothetical protein AUK33_10935 [Flavobacteriaceae bacterium CG2_30_34_30]|nr:MAG: hypothetical protein AUK33_10935 [Flavobacteriaceae bacterium CG2_30_34_30]PIQ19091.1 MAG: hypothetical protein COW66_02970 [Flavobacteriaceae bacterium CG18_big_fil_WC_8_21_14_2_50_34_36]PIV49210.1 MAG: hypothetical protein COS19_09905 [Flavobacteriaceae bacterium CG02_land_8_20_14_3_00_34_13]PIZ08089.1 MAG: hypothetical protein COY56_05645 [Flavobacteriaceae bacterium CG_4_10_14_0_8_um_filter_34_31]PJC06659.1 MAG: hypothetical protein CO068_10050 [Flavobacteriaceae bacterium CG_4_9_14